MIYLLDKFPARFTGEMEEGGGGGGGKKKKIKN